MKVQWNRTEHMNNISRANYASGELSNWTFQLPYIQVKLILRANPPLYQEGGENPQMIASTLMAATVFSEDRLRENHLFEINQLKTYNPEDFTPFKTPDGNSKRTRSCCFLFFSSFVCAPVFFFFVFF